MWRSQGKAQAHERAAHRQPRTAVPDGRKLGCGTAASLEKLSSRKGNATSLGRRSGAMCVAPPLQSLHEHRLALAAINETPGAGGEQRCGHSSGPAQPRKSKPRRAERQPTNLQRMAPPLCGRSAGLSWARSIAANQCKRMAPTLQHGRACA